MSSKPKNKYEVKPPRFLGDKIPKSGGPSPQEAIAKALKLSAELMDQYQGWVVDDLQALWHECASIKPGGKDEQLKLRKLYDMSHDIRGHGGSFGYSLVSILGDSLCKYLDTRKSLDSQSLDIIKLHILAMKAVFNQNLKGDQPELAQQLTELLALLRS